MLAPTLYLFHFHMLRTYENTHATTAAQALAAMQQVLTVCQASAQEQQVFIIRERLNTLMIMRNYLRKRLPN